MSVSVVLVSGAKMCHCCRVHCGYQGIVGHNYTQISDFSYFQKVLQYKELQDEKQ